MHAHDGVPHACPGADARNLPLLISPIHRVYDGAAPHGPRGPEHAPPPPPIALPMQPAQSHPPIAIVGGTGAMGRALAYRWASAGYSVLIGSRNEERARSAARDLRVRVPGCGVRGEANPAAAAAAAIVVLTVPYACHAETLRVLAPFLEGKLLVDTTVPLRPPRVGTVALPEAGSAAVEAARLLGAGVRVVAAFHNVAAHLLDGDAGVDCDVLVAGDDEDARAEVIALAAAAGLRAWHAGPLANAAAPEALTSVLIQANRRYRWPATGIRLVPGGIAAPAPEAGGRSRPGRVELTAIDGIPEIRAGDDLAEILWRAIGAGHHVLEDGDILVVAQKVVSKAEGRLVRIGGVVPSAEALRLAEVVEKDPRLLQLVLDESAEVLRARSGLVIVEHRLGMVMANAGIDVSNVPEGYALLLPEDPDRSARALRDRLAGRSGRRIGVVVSDSLGRAWRNGTVGHALGIAGLDALVDLRGRPDRFGRPLQVSMAAHGDAVAAAATLVMGEADESWPAVLVRGCGPGSEHVGVRPLLRDAGEDLFR